MQLHLTPLGVPWHSGGDHSELSMQWGHVSRHYSTDRSSIGSMESLENPPSHGYYDSQMSPIDPGIFNNKRDSAYSSFSASSNTSDYTVPVKMEETNCMDGFLQGLAPSCRYPDGGQGAPGEHRDECESLKSKMTSHRTESNVLSTYSCEEEHCPPPQPPIRKDSFRATRGRHQGEAEERCVSAPVDVSSLSSCVVEDQHPVKEITGSVYLNGSDELALEACSREPYYAFRADDTASGKKRIESFTRSVDVPPPLSPFGQSTSSNCFDAQLPEQDLSSSGHHQSVPEKLLASQLRMIDFSSEKDEMHSSPSPECQWSQSPLFLNQSGQTASQASWGTSRCSTPGSVGTSEHEEARIEDCVDSGQSVWTQSIGGSGNPMGNGFSIANPTGQNYDPAGPVDVSRVDFKAEEGNISKPSQRRQFCTSKSRRRSERFATNLRNEIQRKKAQLQKNRSPCGEETVQEEATDLLMRAEEHQHKPQIFPGAFNSHPSASLMPQHPGEGVPVHLTQAEERSRTVDCPSDHMNTTVGRQIVQMPTRITPPPPARPVCIRVVEEQAPAGKPRRWRWTPEHKLQLESKTSQCSGQAWSGKSSTTRTRTGSSSGRRSDECDILPFADRRRFFEETSRKLSQSVTNLSSLSSRSQRSEKPARDNHPSSPEPLETATFLGRRRFSYQGMMHDGVFNSLDTRRLHEPQKARDRLAERDLEEEQGRNEQEKHQQWGIGRNERNMDWEEKPSRLQAGTESEKEPGLPEHNVSGESAPSHDSYRKQTPVPQVPSSPHYRSLHQPGSAFHPVAGQRHHCEAYSANTPRSHTPSENFSKPEREQQKKINRKFSLTERDYPRCNRDFRTRDGAVLSSFVPQGCNRPAGGSTEEHLVAFSPLKNRAMSENDLRFEPPPPRNHVPCSSRLRSSTLSDLEENRVSAGEGIRKKGPPPPRPPPPKWEQFHKRRTSHHNLFSSPPQLSPPSPPPRPQLYTPRAPSLPETSRQRSYSLPPREMAQSQERSVAPPSPALSRRVFKPVAPPPQNRDFLIQNYELRGQCDQPEPCTRIPIPPPVSSEPEPRAAVGFHGVEWDPPGPRPPVHPENSATSRLVYPQSYFSVNNSHTTAPPPLSSSISISTSTSTTEDHRPPLETDIDDFCEKERSEEREVQGFTRPVMVLETDLDNMPEEEEEAASVKPVRGARSSLVESILQEDYGVSGKELMGELFPHTAGTQSSGESWRGAFPVSGGTLDRPSRPGPSTTPASHFLDASAEDSPLLTRIREISERKVEDQELNYKKQLMDSLRKKLCVLRDAQKGLQEDMRANAQLGEEVESLVLAVCKPNEVDKYRLFIGDLDKVTSLLLSLSGRLIRVESALDCLDQHSGHNERLQLLEKKKQLLVQMGEAQELKEHVDQRQQAVARVLGRCLTPEQMRDYTHFVKMKAALLVEQRQLHDKIRLGEEQLRGLRESLNTGFGSGAALY